MIQGFVGFFALIFSVVAIGSSQNVQDTFNEERLYNRYLSEIQTGKSPSQVEASFDSKLYMDALWDAVVAHKQNMPKQIDETVYSRLLPADQIRFEVLKSYPEELQLSPALIEKLEVLNKSGQLSVRAQLLLLSHEEEISNIGPLLDAIATANPGLEEFYSAQLQKASKKRKSKKKNRKKPRKRKRVPRKSKKKSPPFREKTSVELQELFFNTPDAIQFAGSDYKEAVRVYVFCRYNRQYKCIMMMTDKDGNFAKEEDGVTPWHHPALGMSRLRLPSWRRNGNTPEGVYRIDGVMPYASKPLVFGKYRRMILEFIPRSKNEELLKTFLPASARDKNWWKSGVVARDIGRNLLRIHGSGVKRAKKRDAFYPLRPTLGCIMQRELKFDGVDYHDQRKLLDKIMVTQGLEAKYENETKIKGLLYLIEIDKKQKSVSFDEVRRHLDI